MSYTRGLSICPAKYSQGVPGKSPTTQREVVPRSSASAPVVAELASEAAMSPSAFHAAFKHVTGQSPMQYLKAVRLHRARQLLAQTQRLASDVAFEVGYQSASQFSRDYKRQFGATPSSARLGA